MNAGYAKARARASVRATLDRAVRKCYEVGTMQLRAAAGLLVIISFARAGVGDPLPASASLVRQFDSFGIAPRSQGARGTCSIFAVTAVAQFEAAGAAGAGSRPSPMSEEFLNWAANETTGSTADGAMFYEALRGLQMKGICSESAMPYNNSAAAAMRPAADAIEQARAHAWRWKERWIRRWNVSVPLADAEMLAIKKTIAAGHPVACGLRWPTGGEDWLIRVPPPAAVFDGHSVALVGYETNEQMPGGGFFIFRNSAGASWGDRGCGKMSFAYVRAFANDAVWLECGAPDSERAMIHFEAEELKILTKDKCDAVPQDMAPFGAKMWSGGKQLMVRGVDGGTLTLELNINEPGRYGLRVAATAAPDYGKVKFTINGAAAGVEEDLYSGRVSPSGLLDLGVHDFAAGAQKLQITIVGAGAGGGYNFGVDAVEAVRGR